MNSTVLDPTTTLGVATYGDSTDMLPRFYPARDAFLREKHYDSHRKEPSNAILLAADAFSDFARGATFRYYAGEDFLSVPVRVDIVPAPRDRADAINIYEMPCIVNPPVRLVAKEIQTLISSLVASSVAATSRGEGTKPLRLCGSHSLEPFASDFSVAKEPSPQLDVLVKFLSRGSFEVEKKARVVTGVYHAGATNATKWDEKFAKMKVLAKGWNGYEAEPPTETAIQTARGFVSAMITSNLQPTRVAPSVVGGVGITVKSGARRVYVEFYNEGTAHAILANGDDAETTPVAEDNGGFKSFIDRAKVYLNA